MKMKMILEELEGLQKETGIGLSVSDPAKYKANMKKIASLNKKLKKSIK